MNRPILLFASFLLLGMVLMSCGNKPKLMTEAEMTAKVDSIYQAQSAVLAPDLDRLCEARFETYVQESLDSILTARNPEVQ